MKKLLLYLCLCTSFLFALVQCKDSITQSNNDLQTKLNSPDLITPEKNSDQSSTITFEWEEVGKTGSYHFQIAGKKNFSSTIVDSIVDSTRINVNDLPVDTTLYWKVRPAGGNSNASWSEVRNFDVISKSNSKKVTLVSPESKATGVALQPSFEWEKVEGADSYLLHVDNGTGEALIIDQKIEGTSYTPPENLASETTHYWRVRAIIGNKKGKWSDISEFTTAEAKPLSAPVQLTPKDDATGITLQPDFDWKDVDGADAYTLHVSQGDQMVIEQQVDGTSFTPSEKLSAETSYSWQVRAVQNGTGGDWSGTNSFTTKKVASEPLRAPALVTPKNDATDVALQPSFEWEQVEGADSYLLHVDKETGDALVIDQKIEGTSYTPPEKLTYETTHHWRVQAVSGEEVAWSEVQSFTTTKETIEPLSAPVQLTPKNDATGIALQPGFEWQVVDGADAYILDVSKGDQMVIEQQVDGTSFTPSAKLSAETSYTWRVRAVQNGTGGDWSGTNSFTTKKVTSEPLPAPLLTSPANNATGVSLQTSFEWQAIEGADSYVLHVDNGNGLIIDQQVTTNSFTPSANLTSNSTYYWRVHAVQDGVTGNWSEIYSFTTVKETVNEEEPAASDRQALMDLYNSTGGDYWTSNSGWGSSDPLGSWHGIETDANGRVVRVDLFDNGLSGQLPASIGDLTKVRYLNVKKNKLTGRIPSSIGNMASLEWLILQGRTYDLANTLKHPPAYDGTSWNIGYHQGKYYSNTNEFSGTIPSEIGNLSNLIALELSNAKEITGPLPSELGNLSNLKGLYLSGTNLTGYTLPSSIGNLTSLKHFYITGTGIVGELPDSFQNLTQLTALMMGAYSDASAISDGNLTGSIPDLSQYTELRRISLRGHGLTGEFPQYVNNGNFSDLNILILAGNNLTGTLPDFNNLQNLYSLDIGYNNMTGDISTIPNLPSKIRIIRINENDFSGQFPQSGWPDYFQLKTIKMNGNALTGNIPCSFWSQIDNPTLNYAWFHDNNINDSCASGAEAMQGDGDIKLAY